MAQHTEDGTNDHAPASALRRRSLIAAAGAVMAGIAAKQMAEPVAAAASMQFADTAALAINTALSETRLKAGAGFNAAGLLTLDSTAGSGTTALTIFSAGTGAGINVTAASGNGVSAQSSGNNAISGSIVAPTTSNLAGVAGNGSGSGSFGVIGTGNGAGSGGVSGSSNAGNGVYGTSNGDHAIYGNLTAPTGSGKAGVFAYGNGNGTFGVIGDGFGGNGAGAVGVQGQGAQFGVVGKVNNAPNSIAVYGINTSTAPNGIGVYGTSTIGTGVYGQTGASNQYGVLGTTYAPNSTAIAGTCTANGSSAFSGGTANPLAFGAVFQGNVVIQGKLVVSDPSYKSGALQHPDGSTRLVYCVESPESWIEDFGEGTFAGGTAVVNLDPVFTAVTHTDHYHVYLTEYGESNGLYVSTQSASGFTVRERNKGASGGRFSWRVVAKPKSSVKSERLAKFVMPNLPLPDTSRFAKPPETPTAVGPTKR